jgi:hypothetical protein
VRVVYSHDTCDANAIDRERDIKMVDTIGLHDAKRKHTRQSEALTKGDLYVQEILCRPKKYDEVAKGILGRVEVVDCLNVEALRILDMLEYLPVGAGWSGSLISILYFRAKRYGCDLRALEQGYEEARHVQCDSVEEHEATEPLVQF